MNYSESEFFGYINGKLLWFANYGLFNEIAAGVFAYCGDCENNDGKKCDACIAYKAEPLIEKQIIDEGVKFMTNLAKEWRKVNRH